MPTDAERLTFALEMLGKPQERERQSGAAEIIDLAHRPGLAGELRPHVLRLLAHEDAQLRAAGCLAIAALGPAPDLLGLLEKAARDSEAPVRREAVRALAGLEDRKAQPALLNALRDADPQVRFDAAMGLAGLGHSGGVDELVAGVDDKHRRFFALGALFRLAEPRGREPAERLFRKRWYVSEFERSQAAALLARLGVDEGRRHLLARLSRKRADERGLVMELCGELKLTEAIPELRRAMADPRELFRGTAARSLGLLHDVESEPALVQLAGDGSADFGFRCDAMEGLMFLRTPDALKALHGLSASGESDQVRDAANDALGWLQQHPEPA